MQIFGYANVKRIIVNSKFRIGNPLFCFGNYLCVYKWESGGLRFLKHELFGISFIIYRYL